MMGGPNWAGLNHTQSSPIIVNKDKRKYYKSPMLYAMGYF